MIPPTDWTGSQCAECGAPATTERTDLLTIPLCDACAAHWDEDEDEDDEATVDAGRFALGIALGTALATSSGCGACDACRQAVDSGRGEGDAVAQVMALTATATPNPVLSSSNLTIVLTVTNLGPWPAAGIVLTNPLPPNVDFVSATASQGPIQYEMINRKFSYFDGVSTYCVATT